MTRLDGWIGGWVSWAPPFTSQSPSKVSTNHLQSYNAFVLHISDRSCIFLFGENFWSPSSRLLCLVFSPKLIPWPKPFEPTFSPTIFGKSYLGQIFWGTRAPTFSLFFVGGRVGGPLVNNCLIMCDPPIKHSENIWQGWILKILALFRFATEFLLHLIKVGSIFENRIFSMNKITISYIFFNKISYLATLQTVLPSHSIPWALVTWTYKVTQMYALHNILMHTRFAFKSILLMVLVSSTVPIDFFIKFTLSVQDMPFCWQPVL